MVVRSPSSDILMFMEVAKCLNVTRRTIYDLAASKESPAFKLAWNWRLSGTGIDDWIAAEPVASLASVLYVEQPIGRAP